MFFAGSQVLSLSGYPAHFTKYSGLPFLILLRTIRSAEKISGSLRMFPGRARRGVTPSSWLGVVFRWGLEKLSGGMSSRDKYVWRGHPV